MLLNIFLCFKIAQWQRLFARKDQLSLGIVPLHYSFTMITYTFCGIFGRVEFWMVC